MITYTDVEGSRCVVCNHCRCDIPDGANVFTLSPAEVKDGYASRDYDKGEIVFCPECSRTLGLLLNFKSIKRAEYVPHLKLAA
jgi:hypothetical protein